MCDFPNIENNALELEMLSEFCDEWHRRIDSLAELLRRGHADESLILCCCYIEAIGKWLFSSSLSGREVFTRALIRYGGSDLFSRVHPGRLLGQWRGGGPASGDASALKAVAAKLSPPLAALQDRFYPARDILEIGRQTVDGPEFTLMAESLWMGSLASLAHRAARCEGIREGAMRLGGEEGIVLDHQLLYPALKRLFESARRLVMAGKLRIW